MLATCTITIVPVNVAGSMEDRSRCSASTGVYS
jgi:hypothetical protein